MRQSMSIAIRLILAYKLVKMLLGTALIKVSVRVPVCVHVRTCLCMCVCVWPFVAGTKIS